MLLKNNKKIFIIFFLGIYIFSLAFHKLTVFDLSIGMNPKLSEITFVPLLVICIFFFYKKKFKLSNHDLLIVSLLILPLFSYLFDENYKIFKEIILSFYLLSIFFVFRILIINGYFKDLINILKFTSIFVATFSIIGWLIYQIYNFDYFVTTAEYPFKILKSSRAKSFFEHPNAMVNFLIFPLLLFFFNFIKKRKKKDFFFFLFLLSSIFLTFSKSLVVIIIVLSFYIYLQNTSYKTISALIVLILTAFYIIFSHLIIIDKNSDDYEYYTGSKFIPTDSKPFINYKNKEVYLNNYYEIKLKSLEHWKENKVLGSGSFDYQNFKTKYASNQITNDHHSTYLYILASKGIVGFTLFLFLIIYSFKIHKCSKNITIVCILFLLYMLIEGINSNLLTSRVTWIVFAILGSIKNNYENGRINLNI